MAPALPGIEPDVLLDALLDSLRFFAYPDAAPALTALRAAGIRTVVVSNWDWSLHERLAETGLAPLVDGALASAEVGSAKPDGAIFRAALARRAPGGRVARRRHARGRRRGRPRGRPAADPDRARRRRPRPRRDRDPIAGRAHTLGDDLTDEPQSPTTRWLPPVADAPPPRAARPVRAARVPIWVPFVALFAVLVVVNTFGAVVFGVADRERSVDRGVRRRADRLPARPDAVPGRRVRLRRLDRRPARARAGRRPRRSGCAAWSTSRARSAGPRSSTSASGS